jgi:hypothetical protein
MLAASIGETGFEPVKSVTQSGFDDGNEDRRCQSLLYGIEIDKSRVGASRLDPCTCFE